MRDEDLVLPFFILFSGCSRYLLFLFPCTSVCHFDLVVFYEIFLSFLFFFYISCLCSRFMFCGEKVVYKESFMDKIVFYLLLPFYLHFLYKFHPFPLPLLCFCCLKLSLFMLWVCYQIDVPIHYSFYSPLLTLIV